MIVIKAHGKNVSLHNQWIKSEVYLTMTAAHSIEN